MKCIPELHSSRRAKHVIGLQISQMKTTTDQDRVHICMPIRKISLPDPGLPFQRFGRFHDPGFSTRKIILLPIKPVPTVCFSAHCSGQKQRELEQQ